MANSSFFLLREGEPNQIDPADTQLLCQMVAELKTRQDQGYQEDESLDPLVMSSTLVSQQCALIMNVQFSSD